MRSPTHNAQVMCEVLGQEGWFEPYALALLRRVLSSYKGAKALVAAADKVGQAGRQAGRGLSVLPWCGVCVYVCGVERSRLHPL